jgi:hypothetical protein
MVSTIPDFSRPSRLYFNLKAVEVSSVTSGLRPNSIPILFDDSTLGPKVTYIPLGIRQRFRRKMPAENDAVTILFTNSWHQASTGFICAGLKDIETRFSIERWNRDLAKAFDKALSRDSN